MEALCDFLVYSIQRILVHSKALGNNVQSASDPSVERSLINNGVSGTSASAANLKAAYFGHE